MKKDIETRDVAEMAQSENRQAGKNVAITREMIEAGASVLYGMELDFASEESWAERVYLAMVSASPDFVGAPVRESRSR